MHCRTLALFLAHTPFSLGTEPEQCKSDVAMLHNEIRDAAGHGGEKKKPTVKWTVSETGCHLLIYKF